MYTDTCIIPNPHSGLFPPQTHVGKLGSELPLPKEEACSDASVPWCYFAVSENNSATDQEKPCLKSVARYSDAILRGMLGHNVACAQRAYTLLLPSTQTQQFPFLQTIHNYKEKYYHTREIIVVSMKM